MTTPSIAQKRLLAAGAKKSAQSWGTAEALGAGYGLDIDTDGGLIRSQSYFPSMGADQPFTKEGDLGQVDPVDFSPEFDLRYDPGAIGILIAQLFGTAGSPDNKGAGAYRHTFQWNDENYGEFSTFAIERVSKIFEVQSAKPYMLDLSVADGFMRGVLGLRGNSLTDNSSVNTATQMDALTYKDRGNRCKFSQAVIKMNDQSGGTIQSETALQVSDMSIHYERPHDGLHAAGSASIIEPAENGAPIVTVDLTFPRMNAVNNIYFTTDFIAEVEKKMEIRITGALIGATYYYYYYLLFPRLRIVECDYTFDEIVPAHIKLQAEEPASNPTGMSYARPHVYLENNRSTDYLT